MSQPLNAGDDISTSQGLWSFQNIEEKFDAHIRKSVPGYDLGHEVITLFSDPFVREGSLVLDIGCSTGSLLRALGDRHSSKRPILLGYDKEQGMIRHARTFASTVPVQYECTDVATTDLPCSADLIISSYTLQFISPSVRQNVVDNIYKSLSWGGGFFMFEKVRGPDARFQEYMMHALTNYKLKHYNAHEVIGKSNSLVGIMEPFSTQGNIDMLNRAGFRDICTISKFISFEGFLAIK